MCVRVCTLDILVLTKRKQCINFLFSLLWKAATERMNMCVIFLAVILQFFKFFVNGTMGDKKRW